MTSFEDRLQKAIRRGQRRSDERSEAARIKQMTEDELKRLHGKLRLQLSEHIEACLKRLPNHFPGFDYQTIYGERGWGGACSRDDLRLEKGRRSNDYSRLEMTVSPFSEYHVIELVARGTIRNKELFNRTHFEKLEDIDADKFLELVDLWVLEYAEQYAAQE